MDQTNLAILQFLHDDLVKTGDWAFHYDIEEALGLSEMMVDISLTHLEQEKRITRCMCGCNGIMISPAGRDMLQNPEKKRQVLVWKTQNGNIVRLNHMSDDHLRNAMGWLLEQPYLSEEYEGVGITTWLKEMSIELHRRFSL